MKDISPKTPLVDRVHHPVHSSGCKWLQYVTGEFAGSHMHILLVHVAIQMKMGLSLSHIPQVIAGLSSKSILVATQVIVHSFIGLMEGLLHLNFIWKYLCIFLNYHVCWLCSQVGLLRKMFYRFLGAFHQCLIKMWMFSSALTDFLLAVMFPVISNLLINLFMADLLGAFLHSDFTQNAYWIGDSTSSVGKIFSVKSYAVLLRMPSWSLLLHEVATRGSIFYQDY